MARETTSLQERMTIMSMAKAGHTDREIAATLGWQQSTVRKWRRQGERTGREGLASHMGRPRRGALSSIDRRVTTVLRTWRQQHPGWGPVTLYAQLQQEPSVAGFRLPKRSTLARWLKEEGFTRVYERHQDLPQAQTTTVQAPHVAWEMDAQGRVDVPGVGQVNLINVNDRFSRLKVISFPCWIGDERAIRHPDTADYLLVLRLSFLLSGLPDQLYVDRDSVYYDNTSKSPFPTRLHLFLIGLGITLVIGPPHQPRKRAITERTHQTWYHQVVESQHFADWNALWQALDERRTFLNQHLPCRSTGDLPPLVAHPDAAMPRRPYTPLQEAELFDVQRIYHYLSEGRWFRKASNVAVVTLGDHHYGLGHAWAKHQVEITFDPTHHCLLFVDENGQQTKCQPIKGLSYHDLAGDMGHLFELRPYQLALPLTWPDQRVVRLSETLGVTT